MCSNYFRSTELRLPDYDNSILSTISSILKYYGIDNNHKTLKSLDMKLKKKYKNVVFIVLDGMGEHMLNSFSKKGYFKSNQIDCVTSVCPSTTTAAMTTYYSGKCPLETGWIAWSQYFKEYGRVLNMLPGVEAYSEKKLENVKVDVFNDVVGYESIYEMLEEHDVMGYEVCPSYVKRKSKRTHIADNIEEMCESIRTLCKTSDKKFILAYNDTLDSTLHKFGAYSDEGKEFVLKAEKLISDLALDLKNTLVVISADHGHKDVENVYSILDYPELRECLIMPEFLESRFIGFWVKENKKELFENIFKKEFKDFILLTKEEVLELGLLGNGIEHYKIDDFLGNYVAVSIGNSIFRIQNDYFEGKRVKKSTHCGLTKEEMDVPVIVLGG